MNNDVAIDFPLTIHAILAFVVNSKRPVANVVHLQGVILVAFLGHRNWITMIFLFGTRTNIYYININTIMTCTTVSVANGIKLIK